MELPNLLDVESQGAWKRLEKTVAKDFEGIKIDRKANEYSHDVESDDFIIECKLRKELNKKEAFRQLLSYKKNNKIPILVYKRTTARKKSIFIQMKYISNIQDDTFIEFDYDEFIIMYKKRKKELQKQWKQKRLNN